MNSLFVTPSAVEALAALAPVLGHGALAPVLADGRARPVAAVDAAEAVRAGADVVADAEASVLTSRVTRD